VSIVLPAKDQAPFIDDALRSLAKQFEDPRELEVIVVDDGSDDGTGDLAAAHSARLPLLRVLRNEVPRGLATARNQGLRLTSAPVVGYMDGDDWLAPGHLETTERALLELGVDFVRTDHVKVTGTKRELTRAPQAVRNRVLDPRDSILPDTHSTMVDYPYAWAGLFRRRLVERGLLDFPDGLFTAEDRPWIWRLFLQAESYAVVNSPGIMYRRGVASSLTQIYDERQLDFGKSFLQTFDVVAADREAERWWPKVARSFLAVAAHHRGRRHDMTTDVEARQSAAITACFEAMPPAVLASSFAALDWRRRKSLESLLPAGVATLVRAAKSNRKRAAA